MPFHEVLKMHIRMQMVMRVSSGELTVSGAAREYGVARNTVKLWLSRSKQEPFSPVSEASRRPLSSPNKTSVEIEAQLLAMKARRPEWGAKKLCDRTWPKGAPISIRTADRILKRAGLVTPRNEVKPVQRFERDHPNELWQMDFKGLGRPSPGYSPLSVLDDATRFCLAFEPQESHKAQETFQTLWRIFGEYGLPDAILTDNEPCFAEIRRRGPSWLECQLWLLGIKSLHGRSGHPQTQGKVERFHRTVQLELGAALRQPSIQDAREAYAGFIHDYNHERPHEALNMKTPGDVYRHSARRRPDRMPEQEIPCGATVRSVDSRGQFACRGSKYFAGKGLSGRLLELREEEEGTAAWFAGLRIGSLQQMRL